MRFVLPFTVFVTLGCMGGFGDAEVPQGDTSAPVAVDPELPTEDDGVAEGEPADTGTAEGSDEGGDPDATEGDEEPQARPRRRRRRRPGQGGAKPGPDKPAPAKPAPAKPPPAPAEEAPTPEPAKPSGPPTSKPAGITQIDDTTWQVSQANVDRWKDDPYILSSVHQEDVGWSLVYARKREAWHLGMRNKDVILEVNGKKLNSKAQLVAAYMALKNKKEFDVLFERKGKKRTHHYIVK
jgi:hypothetical protein